MDMPLFRSRQVVGVQYTLFISILYWQHVSLVRDSAYTVATLKALIQPSHFFCFNSIRFWKLSITTGSKIWFLNYSCFVGNYQPVTSRNFLIVVHHLSPWFHPHPPPRGLQDILRHHQRRPRPLSCQGWRGSVRPGQDRDKKRQKHQGFISLSSVKTSMKTFHVFFSVKSNWLSFFSFLTGMSRWSWISWIYRNENTISKTLWFVWHKTQFEISFLPKLESRDVSPIRYCLKRNFKNIKKAKLKHQRKECIKQIKKQTANQIETIKNKRTTKHIKGKKKKENYNYI